MEMIHCLGFQMFHYNTIFFGACCIVRFSQEHDGTKWTKVYSILFLRKPKTLVFTAKTQKIQDLKIYHLAALLGRQSGPLAEQSLMLCGGELYEIKRRALANFRMGDNTDSLELRLTLTKEVQAAEKSWRDRLLQILDKGHGIAHWTRYYRNLQTFLVVW